MFDYIFNRNCGGSSWQVGVHENNPIEEIVVASGLASPSVSCSGNNVTFSFDAELSAGEEATLSGIVVNYLATGPTPSWQALRVSRNEKLLHSDFVMLADCQLDEATISGLQVYRQELRNLPANTVDPDDITWPSPAICICLRCGGPGCGCCDNCS